MQKTTEEEKAFLSGFPIKDFRHNRRGSSPAPVRSDNKIGKSRVVETPSRRQAGL
jgi:hypothetical protein